MEGKPSQTMALATQKKDMTIWHDIWSSGANELGKGSPDHPLHLYHKHTHADTNTQ